MNKLILLAIGTLISLQGMAQSSTKAYKLYIHREINGATEIIDTAFDNRADLERFKASLPAGKDGRGKVKARSRIYLHDSEAFGNHFYFPHDAGSFGYSLDSLFLSDENRRQFELADSAFLLHRKWRDSSGAFSHSFVFPELDSLTHFRMEHHFADEDVSVYAFSHPRGLATRGKPALKRMEFERVVESEMKEAPAELTKAVGTGKNSLEIEELKIFPNPGDGLIQLSFRVGDSPAVLSIKVLDAKGKIVFSETDPQISGLFLTEIDLRNAGKGTYYFVVQHGKKIATRKLILK